MQVREIECNRGRDESVRNRERKIERVDNREREQAVKLTGV